MHRLFGSALTVQTQVAPRAPSRDRRGLQREIFAESFLCASHVTTAFMVPQLMVRFTRNPERIFGSFSHCSSNRPILR